MQQIDAIVAGAGLWGCTLARVLAEAGRKVLVLERRAVIGGNVRCEVDAETGIEVHAYGSHIFHTGLDDVWAFVNRFAAFNGYQHKVLARHAGRTYFLPLGLALVNQFYGLDLAPAELPAFIAREAAKGRDAAGDPGANFETQAVALVGRPLYDAFIRDYTRKQWGTDPRNLSAAVIRRLPVRASYDVNYFSDTRQGIPRAGYNALFDRLVAHPNISVACGVDALAERASPTLCARSLRDVPFFYSGPVDALFGYRFGPLPWRSLRFETERLPLRDYQGTSVVNYVDADVPFTRIHEFKHYHPEDAAAMAAPATVVCREYPKAWARGDEPYYPVDTPGARALLAQYEAEAAKTPHLVVGGRLGAYRYYDMDRAVAAALQAAAAFLGASRAPAASA